MPAVIAKIRLAKGELGYMDELSGTYLNWSNPEKDILAGTNLRRSVKARRIILVAGSLGRPKTLEEILHNIDPPEPEPIYTVGEPLKKASKKKPVKKAEPVPEPEPEEIIQEAVVETNEQEPVTVEDIPAVEPNEEAFVTGLTTEDPKTEPVSEAEVPAVEETPAEEPAVEESEAEESAEENKPKKKKSKKKS